MSERYDHEVRPTGGRGDLRDDDRRPWWRKLDLIGPDGSTFLRRRGLDLRRGGGLLVHRIDAPDPGADLHDHPWAFVSIVLSGGYTEEALDARHAQSWSVMADATETRRRCALGTSPRGEQRIWQRWSIHYMPLRTAHRITAVEPGTVTFVLRGPKVRKWGFFMPEGWTDWERYPYGERRPLQVISNRGGETR